MPDEQTEQNPVANEQESLDPEQGQPVAGSEQEPVAEGDDGAVAESVDWTQPDTVRSLLEDPGYKGLRDLVEEARLNGENTGRQRFESEMRRRVTSDEAVLASQAALARALGVNDSDEQVAKYATAFTQPMVERAQRHVNEINFQSAKRAFTPDVQQKLESAWQSVGEDLAGQGSILDQLIGYHGQSAAEAAIEAFKGELQGMKAEDLRKDPFVTALFGKWQEEETKAEEAAQQRTSNRVDPGPRTSGTAPTSDIERLRSIGPEEAVRLPDDEYVRWQQVKRELAV